MLLYIYILLTKKLQMFALLMLTITFIIIIYVYFRFWHYHLLLLFLVVSSSVFFGCCFLFNLYYLLPNAQCQNIIIFNIIITLYHISTGININTHPAITCYCCIVLHDKNKIYVVDTLPGKPSYDIILPCFPTQPHYDANK